MGRKKNTEAEVGAGATCPQGHLVIKNSADGEFNCDGCDADIFEGAIFFGCVPCDYSLCSNCYIKKATGELVDKPKPVEDDGRMDPDVLDLCDHFNVEERVMYKLNEVMKQRQDTFACDMEKLWEELQGARSPSGLCMAKVRQMMDGTFVGNTDNVELKRVISKYRLDHDAKTKLTGFLSQRPQTMEQDLIEIEKRIATSNNPSATVMMCMVKMHKGEKLPEIRNVQPHRDYGDTKGEKGKSSGKGDKDKGGRARSPRPDRGGYSDVRDRDRRGDDRGSGSSGGGDRGGYNDSGRRDAPRDDRYQDRGRGTGSGGGDYDRRGGGGTGSGGGGYDDKRPRSRSRH